MKALKFSLGFLFTIITIISFGQEEYTKKFHEESLWLLGLEGYEKFRSLASDSRIRLCHLRSR